MALLNETESVLSYLDKEVSQSEGMNRIIIGFQWLAIREKGGQG